MLKGSAQICQEACSIQGSPLTVHCCGIVFAELRVCDTSHMRRKEGPVSQLCHPQRFLVKPCVLCTRVQFVYWGLSSKCKDCEFELKVLGQVKIYQVR